MKNSRFTVAAHILAVLSLSEEMFPGGPLQSHRIAESVNTNPIVIRRILAKLRKAGLVKIYGGATGGARLARNPDQITLLDVYRVIEDDALFALHPNVPSSSCPVGSTIKPILSDVYDEVDGAIEQVLSDKTIGDLYREMRTQFCDSKNLTVEALKAMGEQHLEK